MTIYSNHYVATPSLDKMLRLMKEVDDFALTKRLYVESKFTDGSIYELNGTRVIVGPPVNDFDVNTAQAIIDGFDILWLADDDMMQRAAKLAQYGMGNDWTFMPTTEFKMEWTAPKPFEYTVMGGRK